MSTEYSFMELWTEFHYDITKATHQLLALLRGAEMTYDSGQLYRQRESTRFNPWSLSAASPSYLDSYPVIEGTDAVNLFQQRGEVEQLAYKGWVVEVASVWEHNYRGRLKRATEAAGSSHAIQPKLSVMGDFQKVRNDLVHNRGLAIKSARNKCEELKQFSAGEPITLDMFFVLDFLHRLGCLSRSLHFVKPELDNRAFKWEFTSIDNLKSRNPTPKIVPVRTELEANPESGELWFLISLVFSNGFFSQHAGSTELSDTKENWEVLRDIIKSVCITEEGNLDSEAPWMKAKAQDIYELAVGDLDTPNADLEKRTFPRLGFPGPWIHFREPPQA